jgi:tRNA-dihydrouridine synthase
MFHRDILVLAPMAAVTTPALRCIVEDFGGCDLYFTEMISASALLQHGPYEPFYLIPDPAPEKLVYQLVGGKEEPVARAAECLDGLPGYGVDFNMGCCAPEIVKTGGGISWMRDLERARRLIGMLRPRLKSKTLSVKLRVGYTDDPGYLVRFCRALEEEGADFLTLHPRIKKEKFSRIARWDYLDILKKELSVPVVGNGDIRSYGEYALKKAKYTCDGIMIGRSAARAPWFFRFLRGKDSDPAYELTVDLEAVSHRFLELLPRYQPRDFLESRAKRFLGYFCENLFFGHRLKTAVTNAKNFPAIEKCVADYFLTHPEERFKIEKN